MTTNRSIPRASVIPVLAYPRVEEAADWLCAAFGFDVRLRIGDHRIQLNVPPDGAVILRELRPYETDAGYNLLHSITVRVADVDAHAAVALERGAKLVQPVETHPYGERQYTVEDLVGHLWMFSQSVRDMAPDEWGGTSVRL